MAQDKKFVTVQEAAVFAGVHPATIRRRVADGTLSAQRFGPRLLRIPIADLENLGRAVPTVKRAKAS